MSKNGRPPTLKLDLIHKLSILIVVNIIPIIICLIVFVKWYRNEIVITNTNAIWAALVVLVASIVYVMCFWMLMPTAKWFKEYAFWQFQKGTSAIWFLPLVFAHILWLVTWIFCFIAGIAATTAIIGVIVHVIRTVRK